MDFEVADEHLELQSVAKKVAAELAPGYVARDRQGDMAWSTLSLLANAGLLGLNAPIEAGGQGAGEVATAIVVETLARGDFAAASMAISSGTRAKLLHKFGSDQVKAEWIPKVLGGTGLIGLAFTEPQTGSDISAVATRAHRDGDGWVLRGEKSSMSNAAAQAAMVLAVTSDGPCLFLVPRDVDGVTVAPYEDMGNRQIGRAVVTLDDVKVPGDAQIGEPGNGVRNVLQAFGSSKVLVCAMCLGAASASLDEAIEWSKDRVTYGAPLATRQGVTFPLIDRAIELEAARLLAHKALWLADTGRDFRREAAMAKTWIPSLASQVCREALLTIGHIGYSSEHPAQLRLRDVLGTELGEGPANTQRIVLARGLFGATPS
jgi:cyclohexanecarboxyl-CoA dehydrogenase